MPKSKKSATGNPATLPSEETDVPSQPEESTSSEPKSDVEISFHRPRPQAVPQIIPNVFMPYIEGPHMEWIVNNGLYYRFLKWRLKCKNILERELAALPEHQKCKKVVAWSRDFGMDQYVPWCLPKEELSLDKIWDDFEEFCKPQSNEVWAHFDLLTSFRHSNKSIDE